MGEHVLAGKLICGDACRADRFCCPIIGCGFAYRAGRFRISSIRVCLQQKYVRRAENGGAFAGGKADLQRRVQ